MSSKKKGFAEARLADLRPIRWLRGVWDGVAQVMGEAQDDEVATLKDAVSIRAAQHCPEDAAHLLAQTRKIPLFAFEPAAAILARAGAAFSTWEAAGLPQAIIQSLELYGIGQVDVYNYDDFADGSDWYSKFWVKIKDGITPGPLTWGGFNWGDYTWGSTTTLAQVRAILGQVVYWKSPQSLPVAVIVDFGSGFVWGVDEWGASTWGGDTLLWPLANMWGEAWVLWGAFKWGNGRWHTGEVSF